MATTEELLQAIKSFATGSIKGATTDTLGAPVDIVTELIRPLGYTEKNPTMGSRWLRQLTGQSVDDANLMETVGSLFTPGGAMHAALMAMKLTPAELKYFNGLKQDITGKEVRSLGDVPKDYDMPSTVHFEGNTMRFSDKQIQDIKDWIFETVKSKDVGEEKLPPSFYRNDKFGFGYKAKPANPK